MLCKIYPITFAFIFNLFAGFVYCFFARLYLFAMDRKYTHLQQHSKHLQRNSSKEKKVKEEVFEIRAPDEMDIKWVKEKSWGERLSFGPHPLPVPHFVF